MLPRGKPRAIQIIVEFNSSLLSHFSVATWNAFVDDLMEKNLIPPMWSPGERPSPVAVMLDFSRLQRRNYRLDGINLALCWLENADFTGASLKNAHLGCGRHVCYRECRLDNADFTLVEISGCDFTDCTGIETAIWDRATYDPANPPVGLPPEIVARCKPEAKPPPENPRAPSNPAEPTGFMVAPLRACVTIHEIPME